MSLGDIKSSMHDLEAFEMGTIWKDVLSVLNGMHIAVRDNLELVGIGTGVTPDEMPYTTGYYQGQAFMLRTMKDIVTQMKKVKQESKLEEPKNVE
jgi:hypothetical protein